MNVLIDRHVNLIFLAKFVFSFYFIIFNPKTLAFKQHSNSSLNKVYVCMYICTEIKQKAFVRNRQYFIKISGRPQDEFYLLMVLY